MSAGEVRCYRCRRRPEEIEEYVEAARVNGMENALQYVLEEEGTLNDEGGFACTRCYVEIGLPSEPEPGWKAPLERELRREAQHAKVPATEVRVGDWLTSDEHEPFRWVHVIALGAYKPRIPGHLVITFRTARHFGRGMHDTFVWETAPDTELTVDASARGEAA